MLKGKRIVLGVTGSIAAFKAAVLCSTLVKLGATMRVVMTQAATKFMSPLTFQTLTHHKVYTGTFDDSDEPSARIAHIELAESADILLIAPASANSIAKLANGIADDMLTNVVLATKALVVIAPAMNVNMFENPAVQQNIQVLRARGVVFIEPDIGALACGQIGVGRLAEPDLIVENVILLLASSTPAILKPNRPIMLPLEGQSVLVTAGGTIERIDPVRYITNDSSGKMGFAMAAAALALGANVTIVAGRVDVPPPQGANMICVQSALEMYECVLSVYHQMNIVIMAAAVADYRPARQEPQKLKKTGSQLVLVLEKNPDILEELGRRKFHQFLVGFAAETENVEENALDKLRRKRLNMIVANNVANPQIGFGSENNEVSVYDHSGLLEQISLRSKTEVASRILALIETRVLMKQMAPRLSSQPDQCSVPGGESI